MTDAAISEEIARLLASRETGASLCPSEAARSLASDWRPLMDDVRRVAAGMGNVIATQGETVVDPLTARGPIRLRWAR